MQRNDFDYISPVRASQYDFVRIPRAMLNADGPFAGLSLQAKLLYGLLLSRMEQSVRNGWLDNLDRAFVLYPIYQIQDDMSVSKRKAIESLAELEAIGLVEKEQSGGGKPNLLYVKNFVCEES